MERHEGEGFDDTFYQTIIRFAEDVIIDHGKRTDPADYYNYMEAPTSPRWEADHNDLHVTLRHSNLRKHESKPFDIDHKIQKYGKKTVNIRPGDQLLGGIELTYRQTGDGDLKSINVKREGTDLLMMELQEYADDYR